VSLLTDIKIISGAMHPKLTERICRYLGVAPTEALRPCPARVAFHADGDDEVRIDESLRGKHVCIVQPFAKPAGFWLNQLLVIIDAVKRAKAVRITVVIPYFGGSRQDRKKPREPITIKLYATLLKAAGATGVLLLDLHSLQSEQSFDNLDLDHVQAHPLFVADLHANGVDPKQVAIVGPDANATLRFASPFLGWFPGSRLVSLVKVRLSDTEVETLFVLGRENIPGRWARTVDDMITTATTLRNVWNELSAADANGMEMIATHALMVGRAYDVLLHPKITRIVVTNSLPTSLHGVEGIRDKLHIVDVAPLLAEAMKRIHTHDSLSDDDGLLNPRYWIERVEHGLDLGVPLQENASASTDLWDAVAPILPRLALGEPKKK